MPKKLNSSDDAHSKASPERGGRTKRILYAATIPVRLFSGPALGFFIGYLIDRRIHTSPLLTIIFMVLGFAAGVKQLLDMAK